MIIIRVLRIILVVLPEHPSDNYVFTMNMEILLEPASNKLMIGDSDVYTLEDPTLILEILSRRFFLRLNLPDHRFKVTSLRRTLLDLCLHLYASSTTSLVGYTNAYWAGCPSTRMSTSAKYRGVANVVAKTAWLSNLLRELHSPLSTATLNHTGNKVKVSNMTLSFSNIAVFHSMDCLPHCLKLKRQYWKEELHLTRFMKRLDKSILWMDARFNKIFNKAMVDTSIIVIKEVLNCYHGFEILKSLVDNGGGLGITLNMIISKHPKLRAELRSPAHVNSTCTIISWYRTYTIMMTQTPGGKERTEDEFLALAKGARFWWYEKDMQGPHLLGHGVLQVVLSLSYKMWMAP
ncbi:ribonuclease H-like domain-containing protein [Tanacetum coccineum]